MTRFARSGRNWEGRSWVVNPAIDALASQIEAAWPEGTAVDGTVASRTHDQVSPTSDHRPYPYSGSGVVHALDMGEVTEDDGILLAEQLRASRDPRLRYVIHESRLFSSYSNSSRSAWSWGPYGGSNVHLNHVHVSVYRTAGPGTFAINLGDEQHMVTRADKADDGLAVLKPHVDRARAKGIATPTTQPGGVAFNDEILAMLDRAGLFDMMDLIADLQREVSAQADEIATLKSQGGTAHNHDTRYLRRGQSYPIG